MGVSLRGAPEGGGAVVEARQRPGVGDSGVGDWGGGWSRRVDLRRRLRALGGQAKEQGKNETGSWHRRCGRPGLRARREEKWVEGKEQVQAALLGHLVVGYSGLAEAPRTGCRRRRRRWWREGGRVGVGAPD